MPHKPVLSIVIPAFNEAAHLGKSLGVIANHAARTGEPFEIVVVDDGSSDGTWEALGRAAAKVPGLRGIRLSRNFGKERALCAGLEAARGQAVIVMDADLQHPPALIGKLVTRWRQGDVDIVEAVKTDRGRESTPYHLCAGFFYRLLGVLTGFSMKGGSDFKLLDRRVVEAWAGFGEHHVFFRGLTAWMGFRRVAIPFRVRERAGGQSKWSPTQLWSLAANAIVSYSAFPLRLVWFLGLGFFLFSILLTVRALYLWATGAAVAGFTTVIILQLIIGSVILLALGVLGEYIGKIFDEVKHRPRYLVMERLEGESSDG